MKDDKVRFNFIIYKTNARAADQAGPFFNKTESSVDQEKMKNNFNNGNQNFEYVGHRLNGMKEGFGIQKWKDGAVYKGHFHENRANGIGHFKHSDGDDYKGEFINDRACGYGIYRHSNGATYEGYWLDDCQNGIGEEFWMDDSQYRGNYVKGKKQGIGIKLIFIYLGAYKWADGSRYEGEWFENCLHGHVRIY